MVPAELDWMLAPFQRPAPARPVIQPQPQSVFGCPMRQSTVAWESRHTFNPAVVVHQGALHMLYRAEDDTGNDQIGTYTSRLGLAISTDGIRWHRESDPVFFPDGSALSRAYEWPGGIEDPRLVVTPEGHYVMTYTAWDRKTARLCVATSPDLRTWTRHGPAFGRPDNGRFAGLWSKSGSIVAHLQGDQLVAARIQGRFWMYWGESSVFAATSTDLIDWNPVRNQQGLIQPVFGPRPGRWDSTLVEPGPPALATAHGIRLMYNGKNDLGGDPRRPVEMYASGQALMDGNDPLRLIARTEEPFFEPATEFERTGQFLAGTTFTEACVPFQGRWYLFYGTADTFVGHAIGPSVSSS